MMIRSASRGFSRSRAKFTPSEGLNSNKRWMVFACTPVVSVNRFAALPVGAANKTDACRSFRSWMMDPVMVLFPVPGPPVRTLTFSVNAVWMASFC